MSEKPMKEKEYYAHSREGKPSSEWHRLEDHLNEVAETARTFANDFQAGDWAYLAGVWHDLGKCSRNFRPDSPRSSFLSSNSLTTAE
jgi:CRISPR-associated endonuclease/helicase Cas3